MLEDVREWAENAVRLGLSAEDFPADPAAAKEELAGLRAALTTTRAAGDRLEIIAEMIGVVTMLLMVEDEEPAAECLEDAIARLEELRTEQPAGGEEGLAALSLLAEAYLIRDTGPDLDDAVGYLRTVRGALLPDDPDLPLTEVRLATALSGRCRRTVDRTDLDEALDVLTCTLQRLTPGDPRRASVLAMLAGEHATRYGALGGPPDDQRAALAYAAEARDAPGAADDTVAGCHVITAMMALTRHMTVEQRSITLYHDLDAALRGGTEAAELLSVFENVRIDPEDAETALRHLGQVSETAELDVELAEFVPVISSLAAICLIRAGRFDGDATVLADRLRQLAGGELPGALHPDELHGLHAVLLSAAAEGGSPDDRPAPPGAGAGPDTDIESLAEMLGENALRLPPHHPMRTALLDQLRQTFRLRTDRAGVADDAAAEVERIVAALERLPSGDPGFAPTLTMIASQVLTLQMTRRAAVPLSRLSTQLEGHLAGLAPDDPVRPLGELMYWAALGAQAELEHRPALGQEAIDGAIRNAERTPADHPLRPYTYLGVALGCAAQCVMTGELRHLDRARAYLDRAVSLTEAEDAPAPPPEGIALTLYARYFIAMMRYMYEPESCDLASVVADLEPACDLLPPDHPLRQRLGADLAGLRIMVSAQAQPGDPTADPMTMDDAQRQAVGDLATAARSVARDHPDFPGLAGQAASALMLQALADADVVKVHQAIELAADACAVPGLSVKERPRLLEMLGSMLLTRHHLTREPRDLSNAVNRLEDARRAVEQEPASPYAAKVLQSLAGAYRLRAEASPGDTDRAVRTGLEALRERAGNVLLQNTDAHALSAARLLTSDATEVARWSLGHGRPGPAVDALELGRGMVLHAATAGAGLADVLRETGYGELAAEWTWNAARQVTDPDDDLRYRIMAAIEGSPAEARLLAPPRLGDITSAICRCAADALVYLLPQGMDGIAGLAIIVRPDGVIDSMPIPGLRTSPGGPVHAYLRVLGTVTGAGSTDRRADTGAWRDALDAICDWAWRTVVRPLLGAVPGPRTGPRRIVLVPSGELGLVPWHAAREETTSGYRYAAERVVFSYAASARQFVETSERGLRQWAETPVLISDAAASVYATELGIRHLHTSCYPGAAVHGHAYDRLIAAGTAPDTGSPAATPDDVLAVLPHSDSPAASLLHFGGHGWATVPVLGSGIVLDNRARSGTRPGDPAKTALALEQILRRARTSSGRASGGLVVLASCLTDVTGADYDEALTLATAFVAAGAVGVVGARWRVPDIDTALFMIIFHHYLNGRYPDPADALHAAQLWMLNPDRSIPEGLPAIFRERAAGPGPAHPLSWAGFAYQGR